MYEFYWEKLQVNQFLELKVELADRALGQHQLHLGSISS